MGAGCVPAGLVLPLAPQRHRVPQQRGQGGETVPGWQAASQHGLVPCPLAAPRPTAADPRAPFRSDTFTCPAFSPARKILPVFLAAEMVCWSLPVSRLLHGNVLAAAGVGHM